MTTTGPFDIDGVAARLFEAERVAKPIGRLTHQYPTLDPSSAYRIQERYARLRQDQGAQLIGRKIGCTSRALQEMFAIDTPDYGHLFDDMLVSGSAVDTAVLIEPMVEPEIAFVLARELRGPGVTRDDALAATGSIAPAIEIIDSRIIGWDIGFCDTVADNGSSARFVLGEPIEAAKAGDTASEVVRMLRDGTQVDEAVATAVLGHPANAVAWLANVLAEFDRPLAAGAIVLSGSITKACRVRPGETYEAEYSTLGRLSCAFV